MIKNILLKIEYDGTNFSGWQRQPDKRTVQGELEKALSIVCGQPVSINGTSRTDAGVHALGQQASFTGDFGIPTERIAIAANNILAGGGKALGKVGDVKITETTEMPLDFHARFNAKGKTYIYRIKNQPQVNIFERNYFYQVTKPLDVELMKQAAQHIVGTHDFKCFQASGGEEKETTVRTVHKLNVAATSNTAESDNLSNTAGSDNPSNPAYAGDINIEITGDGFLYNMVRIITGTLVEAGLSKIKPEEIKQIIAGKNRQAAGHTAPPQGLYLAEVYYDVIK